MQHLNEPFSRFGQSTISMHIITSILLCTHPNLFYLAPIQICAEQTHQQQLEDDCKRAATTHYITSPTSPITLHYITSYYISTTHYIISRALHLAQRLQSLIILLQLSFIIQPTTHHSMQMLGVVTVTVMLHSIYGFEKNS